VHCMGWRGTVAWIYRTADVGSDAICAYALSAYKPHRIGAAYLLQAIDQT